MYRISVARLQIGTDHLLQLQIHGQVVQLPMRAADSLQRVPALEPTDQANALAEWNDSEANKSEAPLCTFLIGAQAGVDEVEL